MNFRGAASVAAVLSMMPCIALAQNGGAFTCARVSMTGPAPRIALGMVYDSTRGKTVLFGGCGADGGVLGDTWEWDGASWTEVASTGPGPRWCHSMAYDSARHRTVMFGGTAIVPNLSGDAGAMGDTWEWDGVAWTQVSDAGPSPRLEHAMAYDSARGRVVLFGGEHSWGANFSDTWEWNGVHWNEVADGGPPPLASSAMAYDSARDRMVLFGGGQGIATTGGMYEWDGAAWTTMSWSGLPGPEQSPGLVFDSAQNLTLLYGGVFHLNGMQFPSGDFAGWDGGSWRPLTTLGVRFAHGMSFDSARAVTVVFGGTSDATEPPPSFDSHAGSSIQGDTWECGVVVLAPDGGHGDAGVPDAGVPDASVPDTGVPDANEPDSGVADASAPDGGLRPSADGGDGVDRAPARCGCSDTSFAASSAVILLAAMLRRRKRRA